MNNELTIIVEQSGLEKTKSQRFLDMFTPYFNRMAEIETKIQGLNATDPQKEDIKIAREIRLALKNNRVAAEKVKDDSKAAILIEGRLIDNLNNIVKNTSKSLEMQCEQIEKDAEIKEAARIEAIKAERVEILTPYVEDATIFPLGTMSQDQFDTMLSGYKLAKQQKEAEAARFEAERLEREAAEKIRIENQRIENERLKAEAEVAAAALAAERAEVARVAKIESDKQAAILKEQQDKAAAERKANEEKLKAAAAEAERLAAELKKKQDAERAATALAAKIEADRIVAEKKAAKAPLKEKLRIAIADLNLVLPDSELSTDIINKFSGFKQWALTQIETL